MKNRTKQLLNYGGAFAPAKNIRSPNKRRKASNNKTYHGKQNKP